MNTKVKKTLSGLTSKLERKRNRYILSWISIFLGLSFLLDPDIAFFSNLPFGTILISTISTISSAILFILIFHFARKALFDYNEADFKLLARDAMDDPIGAGLVLVALAIMMLGIAIIISSVVTVL